MFFHRVRPRDFFVVISLAALCSQWSQTHSASAATRVYDIVTSQSNIALSGSVTSSFGTSPIQPQGQGSLTTEFAGSIQTDRGASQIQFLSGSSIDANVSGNWQPLPNGDAGAAAADYGGRVSFLFGAITANVAARNLIAGMSSGAIAVAPSGTFDLSPVTFTATSGDIAYRTSLGPAGFDTIAGESGSLSGTASLSLSSAGGDTIETLTIPINTTIPLTVDATTSVTLVLTGRLVATATLTLLPGDFNGDAAVDAADYVAWRKGVVVEPTSANYTLWRTNFGRTSGSGDGNAPVPEPGALAILGVLGMLSSTVRRRGSRYDSPEIV